MKISEIIRLLEQDGWVLKRMTGSHRQFTHPGITDWLQSPGAKCYLKPKTQSSILKQAGL